MAARHGRTRGRNGRWRDRRGTIPARRRRRRTHRRDTRRGGDYEPVEVTADSAKRGVSLRLFSAVASLLVTIICLGVLVGGSSSTFGMVAIFSVGFCAFNAGIALLLSARREESLHMLANESVGGLLTDGADGADGTDCCATGPAADGTDGSI